MSRRPRALLILGCALGLLGAALVLVAVRSASPASAGGPSAVVWVASRDLPGGTPGADVRAALERRRVPAAYARPGAVADPTALDGRFLTAPLAAGDTLTERDLAAAGATKGRLPVPAGMEAVAVAATPEGAAGRYAEPGDSVNVYATFTNNGGVTRRILSGATVLATEAEGGTAAGPAAGVVYLLAVTPDQAPRLVFGQELGKVRLTLVPEGQIAPTGSDVTLGSLR